ncbi:glyoxylate reductase/hydroxypyruvate reductase-like [Periplaneta americana]|uniref:glyoxylate reductase/hydroxypyruvate reductase-like n=1 Tax=Periplaneta americana TaxID=6978 RepID=UPI0037E7CD43
MSPQKPRVFITCTNIAAEALQLLQEKCDIVSCTDDYPSKQQVYETVKGVDAIFWYWLPSTNVDKDLLDAAGPNLKVVASMSSGYEHMDVNEMKKRGIQVGYGPDISSPAVADMAITLLLSVVHRLREGQFKVKTGAWRWYELSYQGHEIFDSTVGIVGFGSIGQAVAKRLVGFELKRLLYCGRSKKQEAEKYSAEFVSFDELLKQSDYIIITCRLNNETRGMFNEAAFSKMRTNSVLINVARGEIVDHEALTHALLEKKIWGAGLDVTEPEPLPVDSPLLGITNCVITPHIASSTVRTKRDLAILTVQNILAALEGKPLPSPL